MASELSLSVRDESMEISTQQLEITQITAGNYVAQNALVQTLITATQALILGVFSREAVIAEVVVSSGTPADPNAQRERKWVVWYTDNVTGDEYRTEIPTADITGGHKIAFQDTADLLNADWVAYRAAFEAVVRSKDGNAVTVRRAKHVGRNS